MVFFVLLIQGVNDDQSHSRDDEVQGYVKGKIRKNTNVREDRSKRCEISVIYFSYSFCFISRD